MNGAILKAKITERGMKMQDFAALLGMTPGFFSAKLHGWNGSNFTLPQAQKVCDALKLSPDEAYAIFFA